MIKEVASDLRLSFDDFGSGPARVDAAPLGPAPAGELGDSTSRKEIVDALLKIVRLLEPDADDKRGPAPQHPGVTLR